MGNKIGGAVIHSNMEKIEKQELVEEIVISPEKNRLNIKQIKKNIIKLEHYKICKLLNDSTVSNFLKRLVGNKLFIIWSIIC